MSTRKTSRGTTGEWSGSVIARALKAWMAGYEMTHTDFAIEVGMVPRTLERRLKTGKFLAEEVARCAKVMSEISGDYVSIADLHAGRISVFGGTPPRKRYAAK